jgi:pimeloyl-ACP methyl ester carboxylesterase
MQLQERRRVMKIVLRMEWKLIGVLLLLCAGMPTLCWAGVTEVQGSIGPGAYYLFLVPDGQDGDIWNGEVVYYAHGLTEPALPVVPFTRNEFTDAFVEQGYAFAESSFSINGYAVQEGIEQTHQLRGLFVSRFGTPTRSYVIGHSMGGLIAVALAEKYGRQYDGAMPICAPVGGDDMGFGNSFDTRAVFDYYFPGVLPGDALHLPAGVDFWGTILPSVTAAMSDPDKFQLGLSMADIDQLALSTYLGDLPWGETWDSIIMRLYITTVEVNDALDQTHGHSFFDNSNTVYSGSSDDDALNAGIDRFTSTPDAENFLKHYYEPTGKLKIPVLTLHTERDPLFPMLPHQNSYREAAEAAGSGDFLVQQYVDSYGHCTMSMDQTMKAFDDLVNWVHSGNKPTSGLIP